MREAARFRYLAAGSLIWGQLVKRFSLVRKDWIPAYAGMRN